jgi:hypothetical protein
MQTIWATGLTIVPRPGSSEETPRGPETFREGDEVVLASGTHQGTLGVFLKLTPDANWAEIRERDGGIRSHPMVWLAHSNSATPGFSNMSGERP